MPLSIAAKAKCKHSGLVIHPSGYKVDVLGNITHIDTEPNPNEHSWERIEDFHMSFQVTHTEEVY